ncbi:MAG: phosphoadenylyl-sulfate reductase [Bacteroidia bacterium]|nr:MAG: phosphoadenylyl-sulfate reductase [Bacteroidia bacterium]
MEIQHIVNKLAQYRREGKRMFATSSFQTQSAVLLHVLSRIDKTIPVYFVNTGFHFPETLIYKDLISQKLGIHVISLFPPVPKSMQTRFSGDLMFTHDPDYCCYLNKVQPIESILGQYDVWINGVRAEQNQYRKHFREEVQTKQQIIRYHPLLKWTDEEMRQYISLYQLPVHPLEERGYKSIGCEPCTRPVNGTNARDSRWVGMKKTECGLHMTDICTDTTSKK